MKKTVVLLLGFAVLPVHAVIISQWTFETSVPTTAGPLAAELGTGEASAWHSSQTTYSNPAGNGSDESWSANSWSIGDYWQFRLSTKGYTDVSVGWDQTRSSTGPGTWHFAYSINGSDFTVALNDYTVTVIGWSSSTPNSGSHFSVDLSALGALEDTPAVYFRITAASAPGGPAGTSRIDNFTVEGSPITNSVPESLPFGAAALTLGGLLMASQRRR